jgi:predicted DNA-binding protein YlxM (UPF0122 family)
MQMTNTEENKQNRSTGFYEAKGKVRETVILDQDSRTKMKELADRFDITKGAVLDALLKHADIEAIQAAGGFEIEKPKKTTLAKKMKDATPEQLAEIQRILGN